MGIYLYNSKEITPIELPSPREILPLDANDSITHFGLGSTTAEPRRRKKVGEKEEAAK